jgi:hypothetical protein
MNLARLEAQIRGLVEDRLISALPGQRPEDLLVQRVIAAMRSGAQLARGGRAFAPDVYTFVVHPSSLGRWNQPALLEALKEMLTSAASENGYHLNGSPAVTFADDLSLGPGQFRVLASHRIESMARTQDVAPDTDQPKAAAETGELPPNAFLIVEGTKQFPLRQSVVNIGRRLDNTLVVDDPRVSRHHAQLRAIKGRYVLFDLNSSGGTFINGQRTSQSILYPGDVISLAGVSLIFGQDIPVPQRDLSKTAPHSPRGADRATAIIRNPTEAYRKSK